MSPKAVLVVLVAVLLAASSSNTGAQQANSSAAVWLERIGVKQGICFVAGAPDARLPVELARSSQLVVYVQTASPREALAAQKSADAAGLLGTRVYIALGSYARLHLADNIADAAIVTVSGQAAPREELLRIVHPGAKIVGLGDEVIKPCPPTYDDWTHPYHGPDNNPQSADTAARAPYLTQFLAEPWYCPMPEVSVTAGGRMFKAFGHIAFKEREWPLLNKLVCLNAYNGTLLWQRDLREGFMIHRNTMVATPEVLYLADDVSCKVLEAATGQLKDEITLPSDIAPGPVWKWMALKDGVLYALLGDKETGAAVIRGTSKTPGWPWNGLGPEYDKATPYGWGFGRTFVAIELVGKKVLWSHQEQDPIDARAVCQNDKHIFFYSHKKSLAALEAATGKLAWRNSDPKLLAAIGEHHGAQDPRLGFSTTSYIKCSREVIFFAGPQRTRLVACSTSDGRLLWDYPEGNFQLVLRSDGLYAMGRLHQSKKFNPLDGTVLADLECYRGNCTRATGTVDAVFSRGHPHTGTLRLDLSSATSTPTRIPLMRPACQDGVVVSNGQLFWGPWMCDCNLQLVGVISLASAGEFDVLQSAKSEERLETLTRDPQVVGAFEPSAADWPAYRHDNARSGASTAATAGRGTLQWQRPALAPPAAPIAAGNLVFLTGADGAVRAVDAATGNPRWTAYTAGPITYPPAIWNGRLFVGSCDGFVYAYDVSSGTPLWKFRAAPQLRTIPVYGSLSSTWPVASGVLVDNGVVYCAAGIASYDGTHVYALDAVTGQIRWQNNTSGNLVDAEGRVTGVSVQGHLLLHGGKLFLAGGNVVSPAIYDAATGQCENTLGHEGEWQKGPRGRELFLVNGQVRVFDRLLYSPKDYQPGRYFSQNFFVQAGGGDVVVRGLQDRIVRLDPRQSTPEKPVALWESRALADIEAVAVSSNSVIMAGRRPEVKELSYAVAFLNVADGQVRTMYQFQQPIASWCLCITRQGYVVVALRDGSVACLE